MYNISDLHTFVAVARAQGITAAARALGISAATTSHRIAKLETALGVKLFHRDSRSFTLTQEGLLYLDRIEPILAELEQAEIDAGGGMAGLRGHLRVTMSPWILARFILPHLARFRQAHPDLTIEFLSVDRYVPLVEEGQDCAIRVGQLMDSALVARKLSDNDRIICAAPDFLRRNGMPSGPDALARAQWVCLPWQMQLDVKGPNGPERLRLSRHVSVSNSDMLTEAALQGIGIAVKSRLAVAAELASGSLQEILPGLLSPSDAPIWFVAPPGSHTSRKTQAFSTLASTAFRRADPPPRPPGSRQASSSA